MTRRATFGTWLIWGAVLAIATVVLDHARGQVDQAHVMLAYLLIVLGGSASGGRALGITLALTGFLLIDYYFQPPYGMLGVGKTLDWLALGAFLVTAGVATHLLSRAQSEAEEARRRTVEVASLARVGSETLSAGRAEDAVHRVADVIGVTLGMRDCSISAADPTQTVYHRELPQPNEVVQQISLPLPIAGRVVGVLHLANDTPVVLDAAKRRFLEAIMYYAALAVDRVRLVAEAEHAEALREADHLKDIVLASVSHDLRTPITTIKALAQSEAMQGNDAAAAIEEQADRLARLVSDLLDLSRLKGGGFVAAPELNTAEDLIGAVVRQTRGLLAGRTLRTVIDLDSPALVGRFDFTQSLRALGNLLENAIRHSPAHEPIELGARRDGDMLVFTVADHGPGVSPTEARRIFEPFYRANGAPPDTGHAGLGLSIARTLAEIQGGRVTHEPRAGGGSVFALHLPATEVGADALEEQA